jgi:putative flippase GtrA
VSSQPGRSAQILADQRVRYLLVGGYNTVFGYGVFAALYLLIGDWAPYLALAFVANVVGVLNAFVAYRLLVFRVRGNLGRDLVRFSSVYLVAFVLNLALLPVAGEVIGLPTLLAQAVVLFVTAVISYLGHKNFSFRRPAEASAPAPTR